MIFRSLFFVFVAFSLPFNAQVDEAADGLGTAIAQCIQVVCQAPNSVPNQSAAEYS